MGYRWMTLGQICAGVYAVPCQIACYHACEFAHSLHAFALSKEPICSGLAVSKPTADLQCGVNCYICLRSQIVCYDCVVGEIVCICLEVVRMTCSRQNAGIVSHETCIHSQIEF